MEIDAMRRGFHAMHSSLRDAGHNPLEAVTLLAAALSPTSPHVDPGLATQLDKLLALAAGGSGSASISVAFQSFLASEARNGLGQYLTPLTVADLIAELVSERKPKSVLDPFAGTGLLLDRVGAHVPEAQLIGIEINPTVANVSRAVARLSGLSLDLSVADSFLEWSEGRLPEVDAVVTNPPFGSVATQANRDRLRGAGITGELLALKTIPAELLGLDLSVSALREGGFIAIVLPQSVLTNARWSAYRVALFRKLQLEAVVSLPEETFGPFKGVAKASVLLGVKRPANLPMRLPYARSRSVGYDESGRASGESDLPKVRELLTNDRLSLPVATIDVSGRFQAPLSGNGDQGHTQRLKLGDVADVFTGRAVGRDQYVETGARHLKVGDLSGSFISWRPRKRSFVPNEVYARSGKSQVRAGDICMTAAAHKPRYIGLKVDLVDELPPEGAIASAEVLVVRLRSGAPISPEQLLFHFRSQAGYDQLQDLVRGSTAHLYASDVATLEIPILDATEFEPARAAFWRAAASFREYLGHERDAVSLGVRAPVVDVESDV